MRGWRREPIRHGLASRGLKTTSRAKKKTLEHLGHLERPPRELYDVDWDIANYGNEKELKKEMKKIIKLFWWCSYYDKMEYFPFDKFFDMVRTHLHYSTIERVFFTLIPENIQEGAVIPWDSIDSEEEADQIIDERWEEYEETKPLIKKLIEGKTTQEEREKLKDFLEKNYEGTFIPHVDIYHRLVNEDYRTLEEKIQLVDEIIDLEHHRGNLWYIHNIPKLREQFKGRYL